MEDKDLEASDNIMKAYNYRGYDNAPQESFFGHMKDEVDSSKCQTLSNVIYIIV